LLSFANAKKKQKRNPVSELKAPIARKQSSLPTQRVNILLQEIDEKIDYGFASNEAPRLYRPAVNFAACLILYRTLNAA
jgi:hypothetical protein